MRFNNAPYCTNLPTQCSHVPQLINTINNYYFLMQHSAIGFYNVNAMFFVRYEELKYSTIHLQFLSKW